MIKIGIVDDHQLFLEGLLSIFSDEDDFKIVFSVDNGQNALIKLHENEIDILITDISMPNMSGLELINFVKTDFPKVKIVVMSSFQDMENKSNVDAYLLKNTSKEILISVIKNLYEKNEHYYYAPEINFAGLYFKKNILSNREKEIVIAISKGYTTDEIANKLFISKNTVESHRKNIFFKLNISNTAQLITVAIKLGIIDY